MKLYHLPTPTDRARIHTLIQANAHGKISRVHMDECITQILFNYRVRHLHMDGYTIHVAEPLDIGGGLWPLTYIETKLTSDSPNCPSCGGKPGYIGAGDRYVKAACLDCGTVYRYQDVDDEPIRETEEIKDGVRHIYEKCLRLLERRQTR